jgi:hypothetical protein
LEEQKIKDTRTVEQIVDDMDLFDDDLMSMVFDGNIEATKLMLSIILKRDDITVVSVVGQREFQNPIVGGRKIMCEAVEKYAESYAEETRRKEIERMLGRGKTPEEISEFCEYDLKFVKKVQEGMAQTV